MKQKVFVSSTSYNLEDVRSEIRDVLIDWNYEPVNFESPDFPINPNLHKHDVCLDNVQDCDVCILIIGSKYGSYYEGTKYPEMENLSVTRAEAKIAIKNDLQILTFVRKNVWNERATYKHNKEHGIEIKTWNAENKEIFEFIDEIDSLKKDNYISQFENSVELKEILRTQLFSGRIIKSNSPTIIRISDKIEDDINTILSEENNKRIILDGEKEVPYIPSASSDFAAECIIYADTYSHYNEKSYSMEVSILQGLKIEDLKAIIEIYYHCFSEFRHHISAFCINQETKSWFGYGPLNFIKTLEMQDIRYAALVEKNERIHHREAACFIDETCDSIFYVHLQPNTKYNLSEEITFDYVNIGLLFNSIPCSDIYNKFFESIGPIPNTIEKINIPLTVTKNINVTIEKEKNIVTNLRGDLDRWVCGMISNNSKKLNVTDVFYNKIIVNLKTYHKIDDECNYKVLNVTTTTLPARNFPAIIVNYNGRWEMKN